MAASLQLSILKLAFLLIILNLLNASSASKFNPTVKVRTQEVRPDAGDRKVENTARKTAECAGVNCMPKPVAAPGSPECRPRYDGDSCCPTWICASDELLAKSLFDKDNNWNVQHDYEHDMFAFDDHHDEDYPPPTPKKQEKVPHSKNFISRTQQEDAETRRGEGHQGPAQGGPSIADNYADFKRKINDMNSRRRGRYNADI